MKVFRFESLVMLTVLACLSSCTHYDVETADTPANRKGFENHLGFVPDQNVTGVYYYADELGADVQYQLSFRCPKSTIERIVEKLALEPVTPERAGELLDPRDDLDWWKPDSVTDLPLWGKEEEGYYWQLWYSEEDNRAFYQEFSI